MKVFYRNGCLNARAESKQDMIVLLKLENGKSVVEEADGRISRTKLTWARKEKTPCDVCGKNYKSVNLHKVMVHGATPKVRSAIPF